MRKALISISLIAFGAIAIPNMAGAQEATAGAAVGAGEGAIVGGVVGGPVGAAVGAGVGGTVGASAGESAHRNRVRDRDVVIVAPGDRSPADRTCVTDSYGNRSCTTIRR